MTFLALQDKLKTAVHFPLSYTSQGSGRINAPHGVRQPQLDIASATASQDIKTACSCCRQALHRPPCDCMTPQNYAFYPKLPNFFGKKLLTYTKKVVFLANSTENAYLCTGLFGVLNTLLSATGHRQRPIRKERHAPIAPQLWAFPFYVKRPGASRIRAFALSS